MYQEYKPNIRLATFVETYWVTEGFTTGNKSMRVLPDGCVDIIINMTDNSMKDANSMKVLQPYLVGTATTYLDVLLSGQVRMIGIRFHPCGITAFTKIPVSEFTNLHVEIPSIKTLFDNQFQEGLYAKESTFSQLQYIDDYLTGKLAALCQMDLRIVAAAGIISQTQGKVPIVQISEQVCLCQRQFERRFKSSIGVSPKTYSRIIRFNHTRHQLEIQSPKSLEETAFECGYYDHAHLIKEFIAFSGHSPVR